MKVYINTRAVEATDEDKRTLKEWVEQKKVDIKRIVFFKTSMRIYTT